MSHSSSQFGCTTACGSGLAQEGRSKPLLGRLALVGDSITELGAGLTDNYYLTGFGSWGWARCFNGGRWQPVSSGTKLTFATSGKRSDQLNAEWLDAIVAAAPDACAILYGTNDAYQGRTTQQFLDDCGHAFTVLRAAGIRPLMFEVMPMSGSGGGMEVRQARVAAFNIALRSFCGARGVPLCRWARAIETTPDTGIGSAAYTPDNLHPNSTCAAILGREMGRFLERHFRFPEIPAGTWISPNWEMAGTGDTPAGWNLFLPPGGSAGTKSIVPDPRGNWWQIPMIRGSSTSYFNVTNFALNNGGPVAGKKVEGSCELQVVSGSVGINCLQGYANPGVQLQHAVNGGADAAAKIYPGDGVVTLRLMPRVLAGDREHVWTGLLIAPAEAEAVVRVRRMGYREIG